MLEVLLLLYLCSKGMNKGKDKVNSLFLKIINHLNNSLFIKKIKEGTNSVGFCFLFLVC